MLATFVSIHIMEHYIPLFPLNLVIFPGEQHELYIFEPRYKQLIGDCKEEDSTFGISTVSGNQLTKISTEVFIKSIDELFEGGEMQITVEGKRRFELIEFEEKAPSKLYPRGKISWVEEEMESDFELQQQVHEIVTKLSKLMDHLPPPSTSPVDIKAFQLAQHLSLDLQQRYSILSAENEQGRLELTHKFLESELERLKIKFNGHFKDMILPDN